ncbi:hypothetical protein [Bartonella sp. DGB2]|uniref:hypothetical protein n=1 Tax=Bartonella sp. DGB2 TaxID=3388426 RepID=UPI00398FC256
MWGLIGTLLNFLLSVFNVFSSVYNFRSNKKYKNAIEIENFKKSVEFSSYFCIKSSGEYAVIEGGINLKNKQEESLSIKSIRIVGRSPIEFDEIAIIPCVYNCLPDPTKIFIDTERKEELKIYRTAKRYISLESNLIKANCDKEFALNAFTLAIDQKLMFKIIINPYKGYDRDKHRISVDIEFNVSNYIYNTIVIPCRAIPKYEV